MAGTPLYVPILMYAGQTNDEIQRRLGRMAWKTVNTVIELSEQQRMKSDPEYANAVQRLRTRECHLEDVELFNTRVIKSSMYPEGVDMGNEENSTASMIVNTNLLREVLKSCASSENIGPELILCAAYDIPPSGHLPLSLTEAHQILRTNFSSSKNQGALPGFVPLFVGMPVILRAHNISTDLKITNGSQGIVRKIDMEISPQGISYCTCAIVEFPDSPVKLEGLPKSYFPILPTTWSFVTSFIRDSDSQEEKIKMSRHQIPIQPGFAVTGHSAQGKTLPKVSASLHEGGFGAYVAASRAKSRLGLCITHPVRLEDLNKPIPHDLYVEIQHLQKLEHNTLVQSGFITGSILPVHDPESECNSKTIKIKSEFLEANSKKRKFDQNNDNEISSNNSHPKTKHHKKNTTTNKKTPPSSSQSPWLFSAGCRWDELNWSCAYDSIFMSLYTIFASNTSHFHHDFGTISQTAKILEHSFTHILNSQSKTSTIFDHHRDNLRDKLHAQNPDQFRRLGQHAASASDILDIIFPATGRHLVTTPSCPNECDQSFQPHNRHIINTHMPSHVTHGRNSIIPRNLNEYISNFILEISHQRDAMEIYCNNCQSSTLTFTTSFVNTPPIFFLEIPMESTSSLSTILPSWNIEIPSPLRHYRYQLSAIIYLGSFHFTSRLILKNRSVWKHDGRINNGIPVFDFGAQETNSELLRLQTLDDRRAHIYIYSRTEN